MWTSGASLADFCLMLARTDSDRYNGISVFLVPMKAPGITAKPIPNFMGEFSLHETTFDQVEVPFGALLGWLLLDQGMGPRALLGFSLVLASIYGVQQVLEKN